jgi:hypothetical protein
MATVNVTCAIPQGLICEIFTPTPRRVVLNGSNTSKTVHNPHGASHGQRTTPAPGVTAVDEDFIKAWLAANAHLPMVQNGVIAIAP